MEIKPGKPFDIFTSGPVSGKGVTKESDHEISIQDTVSESAPQEGAQDPGAVYGKQDAKPVQDPKAAKETASTQIAANAAINPEAGETGAENAAVSAASTIVSGPVGAAISEQLKNLSGQNVEFFLRRRLYIPKLMSPFRQITEEKAAKILSGDNIKKKGRIHASVNEGSLARISGKAEVDELSAFNDQGPDSSLRNRDLAAFLKRATKEFYIESDDGKAKKSFGVYRYVLDGPQQKDMESPRTISFYYKGAKVLNVTPDEIRDTKRCEDTLTTSREVAEKLNGKPSLLEQVMKPIGDELMSDRLEIAKGLQKYTYSEETAHEFHMIRDRSKDGADFVKTGKLYLGLLSVMQRGYRDSKNTVTLDFIRDRLKDHPDDYQTFFTMLKSGTDVEAAKKVFDCLPQPANEKDYEKAGEVFMNGKWSASGVEEVMKPPLDAPLQDRSDILAGIGKYIRKDDYDNNKNAWTIQKEDMQYLRDHSKDGAEFSKIGKLYVETLDSYGQSEWSPSYRAGLDFIIRRLKDNPDEFAVFKGLLSGGVSMSAAIAIFDTLTQPVKPGDYENAAKPFQGDKWWNGEWVQKVTTPHDSTTLDERVEIVKKLRKHNYYGKEVAQDFDRLIQAYPKADDFKNAAAQYLEAIRPFNSSFHQDVYDRVFEFIKTRLHEHPDEHGAYVDLLKSGMNEDAARAVFDNLPKPVSQGDYASAAAALKDAKWSKAGVEEVMKPPLDAPLKDRSDLLAGLGKYIRKDDYENNKNAWTIQKEDMQYLREHSKDGAEFSKIGNLYVETLDSYGEEEWSQYYRAGLDFIIRRLNDHPDEFAVFKGLLSGGVSMSAAIAIFDTLTQPVKPGDYENAAKPFQGDKWWNGEWVQKAATPHDSTTLDERVDLIKKLRKHNYYGKDVAADYDRLIQAYPNADDLRNAAAQYLEAIKTCNSSYHQSDYDKVFDFIKTRLSEHPDEHRACMELLNGGMDVEAARAVFDNLPKPVSQGDYASASAALKDAKWGKGGVEEVMKPPLDAPLKDRSDIFKGLLGHIKYDSDKMSSWELAKKEMQYLRDNCRSGAEFAKLGTMYIKVLDACRTEEIDDYFHSAFELIRTRLQQSPDEFALFTALLENGIDMEDSLKLFDEFAKPVRNESCEERMKAFTSHLTVTFRKSRDSVKEAFTDYKLIAESIDTDESLQQGFDRFALLLRAVRSGGTKKDREGMNFLQATRDTFIWIKDEKKKQSFGNISSDDVTSMLMEELALGTSLEAAKRAVIFRCQQKEESHEVVADDDTVNIGGIKLDVKKLRNILHP